AVHAPGARERPHDLGEPRHRQAVEVADQRGARGLHGVAAEAEDLEVGRLGAKRARQGAGIEIARRLAARDHDAAHRAASALLRRSVALVRSTSDIGTTSTCSKPTRFSCGSTSPASPTRTIDRRSALMIACDTRSTSSAVTALMRSGYVSRSRTS